MADEFYFDDQAADVAVRFFEKLLVHVKGEWANKPFTLNDWEREDIIRPLFGWKRADGTRKYRWAYIEVPRKNGKSTLAAGIGLYLLFADNEPGAEVYSAAADREQATIVFDIAKAMVEEARPLERIAELYKKSIVVPSTRSVYRVLSADAYTKHGLNAHGVIVDELHAQPNRELWDVLTTSTGSRRQPLVVAITTAGYDRESICWEQHEYAQKVLSGVVDDPSYFAYIRAADDDDDWLDPEIWAKANPNLGTTIKLEYLEGEARRAAEVPAYQNTFRRLHLNQWTSQETRWLPLIAWDECGASVDTEALADRECYGGLDLASSYDLASFSLVFPPVEEDELYNTLHYFWIPAANMLERVRRDRVPYDAWVRDGFITATDGNVIDYGFIVNAIVELSDRYNIREVAFDRWGAFQVSQQLEAAGLEMVAFGQGYRSMSSPTKELLRLVLDQKLAHGANPVMRWMADNLMVTQDPAGNVKPDKKKSRERIDGIVSTIMAIDRAIRHGGIGPSIYETRGLIEL